ncbi:MAG: hypothetical protein OEV95_14635, partial [Gemmatimonadota bacterium]|nr:hypothetical protein [Gemmatimonadota bacterium]
TLKSDDRGMLRLLAAYNFAADHQVVDSIALTVQPGSPRASEVERIIVLSRILAGAEVDPDRLSRTVQDVARAPQDDLASRTAFALLLTVCCPPEARDSIDRVAADLPSYLGAQSGALLWLALAYDRTGRRELALSTLRRRSLDHWLGLPHLSQALWLEGKLASEVGDTSGAIRAWRHYLALRGDPDPVLRREVEGVRAALAALEGSPVALK